MGKIDGLATTYNLPNYTGELFAASPEDTPLLSAIGGLTGGESVGSPVFSWQGYDLRDADDARQRVEGADVTNFEERTRFQASNVVEIHQEAVSISYTRLGSNRMVSTNGTDKMVQLGSLSIPASELDFQLTAQMKQIARDVEKTFITGKYAFPSDNSAPRKTRGLLEAITTNVATTVNAADALTEKDVLDLIEKVWENGGVQESSTATLIVNSTLKRALTKIFIKDANYQEGTRTVGGVNLKTLETPFGTFNVMLDRYVPKDKLLVVSLEQLKPAFLEIPGMGHFFAKSLATSGSAEKVMLYGEIGLIYGNEKAHGVLTVGAEG
ncbi:MAG: DUF5309 family protein [Actinomycetaceae bacterium]|nr:DUF5309 family protein [Actinomycetaceae bacterium]